jgi:hypothetical protein
MTMSERMIPEAAVRELIDRWEDEIFRSTPEEQSGLRHCIAETTALLATASPQDEAPEGQPLPPAAVMWLLGELAWLHNTAQIGGGSVDPRVLEEWARTLFSELRERGLNTDEIDVPRFSATWPVLASDDGEQADG